MLKKSKEWRPVFGFESSYLVSRSGQIFSLVRNKFLSQEHHPTGYKAVTLWCNSRAKRKFVHRIVAEAFIGPRQKMVINHKDLDKTNNHLENLEWATIRQNLEHAWAAGRKCIGETHGMTKLSNAEVSLIKALRLTEGLPLAEVAHLFKISKSNISWIVGGKSRISVRSAW
jgi:hypothetical protein